MESSDYISPRRSSAITNGTAREVNHAFYVDHLTDYRHRSRHLGIGPRSRPEHQTAKSNRSSPRTTTPGTTIVEPGLLLFTRKTLFWLPRLHRSSSTDNKKLSRTMRRRLPLSLIMIRQLPTKLYHLEPVNSCRLVNTT